MHPVLRALLPVVGIALLLMAVLNVWIGVQPIAMPPGLQVVLSVALVVALAGLLTLVLRLERPIDRC